MLSRLQWLRKEWMRNFRHHGGFLAFIRCAIGSVRIGSISKTKINKYLGQVDVVTFSVVPGMTALWTILMERALRDSGSARILVGDCSGGYKSFNPTVRTQVIPLFNALHGYKLDLFLSRICHAEFVVISDDDVFWMKSPSLSWALDKFNQDPQIAVVSFIPRTIISSVLRDKIDQPMGSHCLIVRREIWLREKLSFQRINSPRTSGYDWVYDTGDYANVQLIERGYKVLIAPAKIRRHFMVLDGISTWTLKIQENAGNIRRHLLGDIDIRPAKALTTIYALRGLAQLINFYFPSVTTCHLVHPQYLDIAEQACMEFLSPEQKWKYATDMKVHITDLGIEIGKLI